MKARAYRAEAKRTARIRQQLLQLQCLCRRRRQKTS